MRARPQSASTNADLKKKDKQRPKFDKIKTKVDVKKDEAASLFKGGNYADAINAYKSCAEMLDNSLEDFPLFKREISQLEANIYNNIAFCYGKDQQDKQQVVFCAKVIDRALYIEDVNVIIKAYLRRGLAYENLEKYKQSANDLQRVRDLQPTNR